MCYSYISQGRVTEFVFIDVASSQQPPTPTLDRTPSCPGMLSVTLYHSPSSQAMGTERQEIRGWMVMGPRATWPCNPLFVISSLPHNFLTVIMMILATWENSTWTYPILICLVCEVEFTGADWAGVEPWWTLCHQLSHCRPLNICRSCGKKVCIESSICRTCRIKETRNKKSLLYVPVQASLHLNNHKD